MSTTVQDMITSLKRNAIPRTRGFRLTRELLKNELKRKDKGLEVQPLTKAEKEQLRRKMKQQIQHERKMNRMALLVTVGALVLLLFLGRWFYHAFFA